MDERLSEFSSMESQIMKNIPNEQYIDDIQDITGFPRDSMAENTQNSYQNNINFATPNPFHTNQKKIYKNLNKTNDTYSDSNENYESGYSNQFVQNMPLYDQATGNKNTKFSSNNKNNINPEQSNYNPPIVQNPNNYSYKTPHPEVEPIPMDTLIEDSQQNEDFEEEEIINNNNFTNYNQKLNLENESNLHNNTPNIINENINSNYNQDYDNNLNENINQNFNKKYNKEELYAKCRKKGTPPPDGDFSLEGWKLFYPPNEKFFLWNKGETIKNQFIVNNEDDDENIEIYEGEINNKNERHGFGILTTPKYVRKGTWRDGEFTGWNRESRINGDIYEGKFIDGSIFGKGINKSHKGNLYVGDFVESKREGKGELKTKRIHYEGDFKFDKFNGKGILEFLKEGHSYEGEFKNNEINGMGVFKWNNGDVYEGEMTNGKMNGYGKYTYSNGQVYEGNYVNGVKQGLGKLIYPNNKIYEGEFKNGKPYGEGTIIVDGKKINIIYKDGKFQKK